MGLQSESKGNVDRPDINSPEWHDYAMSFFMPNELINGNPLVAGLRRIAEILIGEIISSKPTMVSHVQDARLTTAGRATVVYEVTFSCKDSEGNLYNKVYADAAEVWEGNTDDAFVVHAAATASTRAEGRALRKALKLRVVAAEELCKKNASKFLGEQSVQNENRIAPEQINYIKAKCKALNINVMKFINSGEKEYALIDEVKRNTAANMIQEINRLSNNKRVISPDIMGYNED